METIKTDILIIGGGSAGCMAAIEAKDAKPELDVTVMEKAHIRRSGALARGMEALNVVILPGITTPEEYVQYLTATFEGIVNQDLCYLEAVESLKVVKELEDWGVEFPKDKVGRYRRSGRFMVDMRGDLKPLLARQVTRRGVKVLNRTMATSLLTREGAVAGATGLDVRTGYFIVCVAKATVLATGGCGRFGLPKTGYLYGTYEYPNSAGDGYSLGYRVGAELTGFEYTTSRPLVKDFNGPSLMGGVFGAKLVNTLGEDILAKHKIRGYRAAVTAMYEEIREGRGPIFFDFTHKSEKEIQDAEGALFTVERPTEERFLKGRGIDLRREPVEAWLSETSHCSGHGLSGLVVDKNAKTTVNGLYAAGDVAAVPYQMLTGAFVFGAIGGRNAALYAKKVTEPKVDKETVEGERRRVFAPLEREKGLGVSEFEFKVRRIIDDYLSPPKNEAKLRMALSWIARLRNDVDRLKVEDYHELGRALEIQFILDCAEITALASITRKESRWGIIHQRSDYPERDDENWLKHVIVRRSPEKREIQVSTRPVELKWRF